MRRTAPLLASLLALGLAACTPEYRNPNEGKPVDRYATRLSFDQLDPAKAVADAEAALARGDMHLLGIYGLADMMPGTGSANLTWSAPMFFIEDTGDAIRDEAHGRFNERAFAYAEAYNRVIFTSPQAQPLISTYPPATE